MKRRQQKLGVKIWPLFECEKEDNYNHVKCVECGSSNKEEELLLCDKCDRGYHMVCVKPIVVRPPAGNWYCPNYIDHPPKLKVLIPNKVLYEFFKLEKWSSTLEPQQPQVALTGASTSVQSASSQHRMTQNYSGLLQ